MKRADSIWRPVLLEQFHPHPESKKTCKVMPNTWFNLGWSSAAQSTLATTTARNRPACFSAHCTAFQRFFREERSMVGFFSPLFNLNLLGTRGQFTTKHIYLSASPPVCSFPCQSNFKHMWSTKAVGLQLPLQSMQTPNIFTAIEDTLKSPPRAANPLTTKLLPLVSQLDTSY